MLGLINDFFVLVLATDELKAFFSEPGYTKLVGRRYFLSPHEPTSKKSANCCIISKENFFISLFKSYLKEFNSIENVYK